MTSEELIRRVLNTFNMSLRPEEQILSMLLELMVVQINDQERRLKELEKPC